MEHINSDLILLKLCCLLDLLRSYAIEYIALVRLRALLLLLFGKLDFTHRKLQSSVLLVCFGVTVIGL